MNQIREKHELRQLLSSVINVCAYRGCLVKKLIGGYEVLGQQASTPQEVDFVINQSEKNLSDSIERGKKNKY